MKHRILIVEDDQIFVRPLQRTLEVAGYEILAVGSGEEALARLGVDDLDLVLTDKRLPGMDGVDLVRRIKVEYPHLAVVSTQAASQVGVELVRIPWRPGGNASDKPLKVKESPPGDGVWLPLARASSPAAYAPK